MNSYGTPSIAIRAIKPVSNIKIGWIAPMNFEAAQTRIRVLIVNKYLRSIGYYSNIVDYQDILDKNYNIAIVGKAFDENNYKKILLLKQYNKIVFCDLCEDIIGWSWVNEILAVCDRVIVCSFELEKKVKPINFKTLVIEDAYEES